MRRVITVLIVGSIFVLLLVLLGRTQEREDDLSRSISQWVQSAR